MLIIGMIILEIVWFIVLFYCSAKAEFEDEFVYILGAVFMGFLMFFAPILFGSLHGFTNYYPSNDKDLARITAVTLEQGGILNNPHYRIEVEYLTNSNGSVETDTFYCYVDNNQLLEKAQDNLYNEVWIITGYKGGYETYKDFGTNLLKEIRTKEEEEQRKNE